MSVSSQHPFSSHLNILGYCYQPGFLAPLINRNRSETRKEIQARLYSGPCCSSREQKQVTGSLACSLAKGGQVCSSYGVRVGAGPGVGPEGWLRCSAHPFGGSVCRGQAQYPAFAPGSSEVAVEFFWSFCIFLSIICINCTCMQLFLIPSSFFVFCCLRRRLSRCKHYSKGSQPASL